MSKYSITYENWTEEDILAGDTDNRGFLDQDVPLQGGLRYMIESALDHGYSWHASDSEIGEDTWFTCTAEEGFDGITRERSIHLDGITLSTRRRIARLLGA